MVSDFIALAKKAFDVGREDPSLALLGVIALNDPHTAQRLGQPSGDLRVDPG